MRKLFHIEAIVDHTIAWDIANIASKKAVKFEMRPVVHGGEDEETGELKARPTGKEIVLALARSGKSFVIKDAIAEVKRVGGSPHSIYAACADLKRDKRLKRIGPGEYQLIREVGEKAVRKPHGSVRAAALDIIRAAQNGSGEGVPSDLIAEKMMARGFGKTSISTTLSQLTAAKKVKRVAAGRYRVEEA